MKSDDNEKTDLKVGKWLWISADNLRHFAYKQVNNAVAPWVTDRVGYFDPYEPLRQWGRKV